jgi:hypothetical protein
MAMSLRKSSSARDVIDRMKIEAAEFLKVRRKIK